MKQSLETQKEAQKLTKVAEFIVILPRKRKPVNRAELGAY